MCYILNRPAFVLQCVRVKFLSVYYFIMDRIEELAKIIKLTNANMIDYLFFEDPETSEYFRGVGEYKDGRNRIQLSNIPVDEIPKAYKIGREEPSIAVISWSGIGGTHSIYIIDFDSRTIVDRYKYLSRFPEDKEKLRGMDWTVVEEIPEELKNKLTLEHAIAPNDLYRIL